jgi:hypothetical protein
VITTSNSGSRLGRQLARVAALALLADDPEVEEGRAEALDLLADDGSDVEAEGLRTQAARGRDRLEARDARAEHEHLRRPDRPGRGRQHRQEPRQPLGGEQDGLVARDRRLRRERVHRLGARDPRDRLEREGGHAAGREALDRLRLGERLEEADEHLSLAEPVRVGAVDGHDDLGLEGVADPCPGCLVVGVGKGRLGAGAGLHHDLVALVDELLDGVGHERDTALSGSGLLRDADPHEG